MPPASAAVARICSHEGVPDYPMDFFFGLGKPHPENYFLANLWPVSRPQKVIPKHQ